MDVTNGEKITGVCHVVAMPYPGRGHINPMMNFCKLLVSKLADTIKITFVVTEEWLGFIESAPRPTQIQLRSIPNVIPSELGRALDFSGFLDAVYTKMEAPIEQLLDELESPVTAIIADTYMAMAVSIGSRRNIPVASLWTMSPSVFLVFYHFDLLAKNGHYPAVLSEQGDELINYIPGILPTRLADMPTIFDGTSPRILGRVLEAFSLVRNAQCLLLTSFHELEAQVDDTLTAILPFPVYSVGPSIPYTRALNETDRKDQVPSSAAANGSSNSMDYFKWLDSQPESSVLYVSLGSFLSVSKEQMDEILAGLRDSGVRYLLVLRRDTSGGLETFGEMSKVVPWCDQLRVLCHSSVGGFWTHCGWNSTLEAVFAGVPMLTFPIFFDQIPNKKLIVDDLKVGMKVKEEVGTEGLVKREEIAMIVKKFMHLDGEESKEMRRRATELKEACRCALVKGGSSNVNLNDFIRSILRCQDQ